MRIVPFFPEAVLGLQEATVTVTAPLEPVTGRRRRAAAAVGLSD